MYPINNIDVVIIYSQEENYKSITASLLLENPYEFPIILGNHVYENSEVNRFLAQLESSDIGHENKAACLRKVEFASGFESALSCLEEVLLKSQRSQIIFYLWDNQQWNEGLFTHGDKSLSVKSLPSFYGTRCSRNMLAKRPHINSLKNYIKAPDYLLELAVQSASDFVVDWKVNYETHVALKTLCLWWNQEAMEQYRRAANFALYCWDPKARIWHACDYEEPAWSMEKINEIPCKALFDFNGTKVVAIFLLSDDDAKIESDHFPTNYRVDGENWYSVGDTIEDLQTSQIGMRSLQHLPVILKQML